MQTLSRVRPRSLEDLTVEVAGLVACRQRPGTAKGFVFLVLEDEFGLVNLVVKPHLYEQPTPRGRGQTRVDNSRPQAHTLCYGPRLQQRSHDT